MTPCHQGVNSASAIKAAGTAIFGVGYTLNGVGGTSNTCQAYTGATESGITAYGAVQGILRTRERSSTTSRSPASIPCSRRSRR